MSPRRARQSSIQRLDEAVNCPAAQARNPLRENRRKFSDQCRICSPQGAGPIEPTSLQALDPRFRFGLGCRLLCKRLIEAQGRTERGCTRAVEGASLPDQPEQPQPSGDQQNDQQSGQSVAPLSGRLLGLGVAFVPIYHAVSGWRRLARFVLACGATEKQPCLWSSTTNSPDGCDPQPSSPEDGDNRRGDALSGLPRLRDAKPAKCCAPWSAVATLRPFNFVTPSAWAAFAGRPATCGLEFRELPETPRSGLRLFPEFTVAALWHLLRQRRALVQEMAVMTCACILPSTGPSPNRSLILRAAAAVASARRLASRASISLRRGVPWQ